MSDIQHHPYIAPADLSAATGDYEASGGVGQAKDAAPFWLELIAVALMLLIAGATFYAIGRLP